MAERMAEDGMIGHAFDQFQTLIDARIQGSHGAALIYDRAARVMVAYFTLDIADITSFTFADKIFIRDSYWRIIDITGYTVGGDEPVQVTLMKIVNPVLDCTYTPSDISIGGIVTFVDADDVESAGSEACCNRYGFTWQEDTCYAWFGGEPPHVLGMQGTVGVGNSPNSPDAVIPGNFILSSGTRMAPDTQFSMILGAGHIIEEGNAANIIAGDSNTLSGAQAGAVMIGKNAIAALPGFHLGGGWQDADRAGAQGRAQTGIFVLQGHGDFTNNATEIPVYIDGVIGKHINMFNVSSWVVIASLIIQQGDTSIVGQAAGMFNFRLSKSGGLAGASAVNPSYRSGSLTNPNIVIDTATDTDEHRLSVTIGGGGHPHNDCFITLVIQYTQVATDIYIS
jgi:hypothetical protein